MRLLTYSVYDYCMSFESHQPEVPVESESNVSEQATTLASRMEKLVPTLFRIETVGMENLEHIPDGKKVIFLVTHMSDYDLPIAIATIAKKFPRIKVAEASTHEKFSQNPGGYLGRQIGGEQNSFSVDFTGGETDGNAIFNPENFEKMKGGLEEGDVLVIAAYFDRTYQGGNWRLPEKGGSGGVYLSQITPDAILVPVSVDIQSKKPFGMGSPGLGQIIRELRPKVEVKIGMPFEPTPIDGIDTFARVLEKRKKGEPIESEERTRFSAVCQGLREESDKVMKVLADMLPVEKRPLSQQGSK